MRGLRALSVLVFLTALSACQKPPAESMKFGAAFEPRPGVQTVVPGTNVTVNAADPRNPIVSASGGGGPPDGGYTVTTSAPVSGTGSSGSPVTVASGAITGTSIAGGTITGTNIASGTVTLASVSNSSTSGTFDVAFPDAGHMTGSFSAGNCAAFANLITGDAGITATCSP